MPANRYTRVPETIEAYQITDANINEVAIWCGGDPTRATSGVNGSSPAILKIPTLDGVILAAEGDFVFRKPNGRFDVKKQNAFLRDYAPEVV